MLRVQEINVHRAIVHRLDNKNGKTDFSDLELQLTADMEPAIKTHIKNAMEDSRVRYGRFSEPEVNDTFTSCKTMLSDRDTFVAESKQIASDLYRSMVSKSISAGDVLICMFHCDGNEYVGVLKLDYRKQYRSRVEVIGGKKRVTIDANEGWPELGTRLQKAAFVVDSRENHDLIVLDRQQRVGSTKDVSVFFLTSFLNVTLLPDEKTNTNAFLQGLEAFFNTDQKDDVLTSEKLLQVYKEGSSYIQRTSKVNVRDFAKTVFDEDTQSQYIDMFLKTLSNAGVVRGEFDKDKDAVKVLRKKLEFKGIKMDIDKAILVDNNTFEKHIVTRNGKKYATITLHDVEIIKWDEE